MEVYIRPRLSHSNSLGNDAEKDTAGCRAFNRKYIVIGGQFVEFDKQTFIDAMAPLAPQLESEGYWATSGLYDAVQDLEY